jgi:Biotin-requiring enzyme
MPTSVIMPQMGESVAEGTITKWLKKEGEFVRRDEALFEISTDKVDTEIPAPVGGFLQKILLPEGAKVPINTVVAMIEEAEVQGAGRGVDVHPLKEAVPAPPRAEKSSPLVSSVPSQRSSVPLRPAPLAPAAPSPRPSVLVPPAPEGYPFRRHVPNPDPPTSARPAESSWLGKAMDRDFDDLVYCLRCGTVYVARIVLGSGDAIVPYALHKGMECRICLKTEYKLVRMRGDMGLAFRRERIPGEHQ